MKRVACAGPPSSPHKPPRRGRALPLEQSARGGDAARPGLTEARACGRSGSRGKIPLGTGRRELGISYCDKISFVAGRAVSFQITILKVLAGHPEGRASVAELTRYVSILISSGSDWTDRMRRLAARAPKLEIFADGFVLRNDHGWCITDPGRQFLASLEAPIPALAEEQVQPSGPRVTVVTALNQAQPTLRLVVDNTRTSQPDLGPHETQRSA